MYNINAILFYSLKLQIQWGKTLETKGIFLLIELIHSFVLSMQSNHVNSNYRMGLILICVFGSICLLNGGNTSNSLNYFSKIILKRHNNNSLEVHEKWSIFQVTLLLGVGNGRCIQHQVFRRLSFFTNSKMPLSILVTVQTCPVTRDKVQSS